jgi:hypothetical protein
MTSRERVYRTLDFELPIGERVPRQLRAIPWTDLHFPGARAAINADFPDDIGHAPGFIQNPVKNRSKA